ncbi:MAG: MmcQ/YjbR family DNA-binding protein [Acidimicrobiales bacterium]
MASAEDLRDIALSLPEATEKPMHDTPSFYVRTKFFTKLTHDGLAAVLHVDSLEEKHALLAMEPVKLTTTPHYDGYRMVLVMLANVTKAELREFVTESWRLRAPKKLMATFDVDPR